MEIILILHNIRSVINVGAIFRTADAAGISKIILSGYTPAPIDRFGNKRNDFHKAALGAEELVSWEQEEDINKVLDSLGDFQVIALEQHEDSVDYKGVKIDRDTAVIVGNEVEGIPEDILGRVDIISEIPQKGKKESLNVSVALGIFLFRILDI